MSNVTETKDLTAGGPLDTIRGLLKKHKTQIAQAMPRVMSVDRLAQVAITQVSKNPQLLECAPLTLVGAVVQAAQLGLDLDSHTRQAYLVPFRNNKKNRLEVQLVVGYGGLIDLARRSGKITRFDARVVHEGDAFGYWLGTEPGIKHDPSPNPGPPTHVYAVAVFTDGSLQFDVMPVAEVKRIRDRYSKAASSGPWVSDFEEMAKKTVVRRLCKMLPVSPEAQKAVGLDELAGAGVAQDLGVLVDAEEVGTSQADVEDASLAPKRVGEPDAPAEAAPAEVPPAEPVIHDDGTKTVEGEVEKVESYKAGRGRIHKITLKGGLSFSSFDSAHGSVAQDSLTFKQRVRVTWRTVEKDGKEYQNIADIKAI